MHKSRHSGEIITGAACHLARPGFQKRYDAKTRYSAAAVTCLPPVLLSTVSTVGRNSRKS
jgi:hypothetical protein